MYTGKRISSKPIRRNLTISEKQYMTSSKTIVAISDTHGEHRRLEIPPADILVHCGDITREGEDSTMHDFIMWLLELKQVKHKIFIGGNHDFCLQIHPQRFSLGFATTVSYLRDSTVSIDGILFYGTPWTPFFYDWAFNGLEEKPGEGMAYKGGPGNGCSPDNDHPLLSEMYRNIHVSTNVLICHGPPRIDGLDKSSDGNRCGSYELVKQLPRLKDLKLGLYGHIHESYGTVEVNGVQHSNVCSLHRDYTTIRQPSIITYKVSNATNLL